MISDEDFSARGAARGLPTGAVNMMLGMYRASRAGEFAAVDPTLEQLLGRPATTMRDVLAQQLGR